MKKSEMIAQMQHWVGAKQGDATHKYIVDTYNNFIQAGKGTPGCSKYVVKYTDPWCATTVSAAAIECNGTNIIPTECSCTRQINLFRKMGCYEENENVVPGEGWVIYYNWQGETDPESVANHVGVVESVFGNKITVIEGNCDRQCKRRTIPVGWKYIHGYGVPKYEDEKQAISYVVEKGDNLTKIARKIKTQYGINITWKQIAMKNHIMFPYTIYVGETLIIQ